MSRMRAVALLGVCGIALLAASGTAPAADPEPMSLEDVVRLHVSGVGADELISRIRGAQVDFDLSDPMLEELRLAGLPPSVIQAMIDRQRELHPPQPSAEPAGSSAAATSYALVVHLRVGSPGAKRDEGSTLRVHDAVPTGLRQRLRIDDPQARIEALAVFVACLTATHVPDHWRMESPLGRDFEGTPRHRMLGFLSSEDATRPGDPPPKQHGELSLQLPETLSVELDPAEPHQIVAGVAVRLAGRFYTVSQSGDFELVPSGTHNDIDAWITPTGPDPGSIRVTLAPPPASE